MRAEIYFSVLFGALLTAITGTITALTLSNIYRDIRAEDFPSVQGTITQSELTHHSGKSGGTWSADLKYSFTVNGKALEGDTYRYGGNMSSSDKGWAEDVVKLHPVGSATTVYFDPENPTDSVLKPGVEGMDFFMLLFFMPFNLLMLAMWWTVISWLFGWDKVEPSTATWWEERAGYLRVRVPRVFPIAGGFVALGMFSFICIFIVVFSAGFHPSLSYISIVWGAVFSGAAAVGAWLWYSQRRGDADLVVDRTTRTADFPALYGRKKRESYALTDFDGVGINTEERRRRRGKTTISIVGLRRKGGGFEAVQECSDERRAGALALLLSEKLNLPQRRA